MGHEIPVVTEQQLRQSVKLDRNTVDVVEHAFRALASGEVIMPPVLSMDIPAVNAEVDVKTAYIPGFDGFAVKVCPGFFDNPKLGLASLNGLVILFSARTGLVKAVFLDNGYLTEIRTAAAGAVAARYLAPDKVKVVGVMGTGVQARMQMEAVFLVRPFARLLVWGRDYEKAKICAEDLAQSLSIATEAVQDPHSLVSRSQLVVTATSAREPILKADWLHSGLHITAMGSDQENKNEIEAQALIDADHYVCDRVSQCELLGELRSAIEKNLWAGNTPTELGEIVTGIKVARQSEQDVTICDLTGTGAQDTAIATHAYKSLRNTERI